MQDDRRSRVIVFAIAIVALVTGLCAHLIGYEMSARMIWLIGVATVLLALALEIVRGLARGDVGLDILAAVSMSAAAAFGETLAAAVVAVMYSGGTFLEAFAEGRAAREMHALLARVPHSAARYRDGRLEDVAVGAVAPGDTLLIRQGDVVPVDGTVASDLAYLDTSALTGEPLPRSLAKGMDVLSGMTNAGDAFDIVATKRAADSTYAGIVRLVEDAQRSKAPMSRLADRWSLGFLLMSVCLAFAAWWLSGDPIRAVAVLVVATPCPLILAVPVALVAGVSRAAHFGVLIKGAKPLEAMARATTLVIDKTGTLTDGRPRIAHIKTVGRTGELECLRLAAALEQASKHPMAQAIVEAARDRGLALAIPSGVVETPGEGVLGTVSGHRLAVGGVSFVQAHAQQGEPIRMEYPHGATVVAVAVDGVMAAQIVMADPLRAEAGKVMAALRGHGMERIVLATGDREDVAIGVSAGLGFDAVRADLSPDQKVLLVLSERKNGPVMMVGDGVNDAPALAAADVGVSMGARGAAASAEAADVVLLVDHLDRLEWGVHIAKRTRRIALQSVAVGLGLSVLGMLAAAIGWLTPVQGAIAQEAIDVAVILNALRPLLLDPRFDASWRTMVMDRLGLPAASRR